MATEVPTRGVTMEVLFVVFFLSIRSFILSWMRCVVPRVFQWVGVGFGGGERVPGHLP